MAPHPRTANEGDNDGVIYAIICRVDLNVYVGQTQNYDVRMRRHFGGYGSKFLSNAINAHGRENLVCVIFLAGIAQKEELLSVEAVVIKHMASGARGYNAR